MPGTDDLSSIEIAGLGRFAIPPNGAAITIYDADDARTVVVDSAGALVSALVASDITTADDVLLAVGTNNIARFSWDTTDANANEMLLQLPAGGATDVPVLIIGQAIESVDFGLYNGVTEPRVALFASGAVATAAVISFRKSRGTNASPTVVTSADDLGSIDFYGAVATGEYVRSAQILAELTGTVATTRGPGVLTFLTATDAAPSVLTIAMRLNANQSASFGGAVLPVSSDLAALGSGSLMWADLFLASGGVINFNNGDVVLTQTPNTLTLSGGQFVSSGWRNSGAGFFGLGAAEAVTIASDAITVTKPYVVLDAEGAGTTDGLNAITYTGVEDGDLLLLIANATATITVDDATINLGAASRALAPGGSLLLRYDGGESQFTEVLFVAATDNV